MNALDLKRWAIVCVKDETGLGRMGSDLRALLDPIRLVVIPSGRMQGKPLEENELFLDPGCTEEELAALLEERQGIIFFENIPHPRLLELAKRMRVATVCVPMWEWFHPFIRDWKHCGHFICPNTFSLRVVRKLGYRNLTVLPWPINLDHLPKRSISGPARVIIHNAGIYEPDDRKGTRDTIEAFKQVEGDYLRLLLRVQNDLDFTVTDPRVQIQRGNLPDHRDLYTEGDLVVQVSKAEGLGFGIVEAMASGLPVMTTNYPPMNEYVRDRAMLVGTCFGKYPCNQSSYIPHAHFKLPRLRDLVGKLTWCTRHDLGPISRKNREWAEKRFDRQALFDQWTAVLEKCISNV